MPVLLRENVGGAGGGGAGCMVEAMMPCDIHTQPSRDVFEVDVETSAHPASNGQTHNGTDYERNGSQV